MKKDEETEKPKKVYDLATDSGIKLVSLIQDKALYRVRTNINLS